jgi:hypothetical protein
MPYREDSRPEKQKETGDTLHQWPDEIRSGLPLRERGNCERTSRMMRMEADYGAHALSQVLRRTSRV